MQSEARAGQFWHKVQSQCPQPGSLIIDLKAVIPLFRTLLSDLNSLGDTGEISLSTRFLDESGNILVHLGLTPEI